MNRIATNNFKQFFAVPIFGLLMLFTLTLSSTVTAQDDANLVNDLLNTANILNETLLEITALSDEEENAIGAELDKQISQDLRFTSEKKFNIKKIFNNLTKYVERTKINYNYKIARTDEVNAYAIAGGNMYINTGILDFLDDEDEIAFVIAHEISHNEKRHCIKRVKYAVLASSVDPSFGEIVQVAYGIYSMPFSKYDEFEADENGVKIMLKAGYKKSGAVSFFE